jgi:hypothetical protein
MPEYQPLLDGSQSFDDEEWISALSAAGGAGPTAEGREASERYLRQHWITMADALDVWLPVLDAVFRPLPADARQVDPAVLPKGPEAGFATGWTGFAWHAGTPLSPETYFPLQTLMAAAGDRAWALVERPHYGRWLDRHALQQSPVPLYRLRFAPSTTWAEVNGDRDDLKDPLQAATTVSGDLFTLGREDYFVIGDSGTWGLVYRGGALSGQCVLGVSPRLRAVVQKCFADLLAHDGAPEVLLPEETPER